MYSPHWLHQLLHPQKQAAELLTHDPNVHNDEVVSDQTIEYATSEEHMIIECELVSGVKHVSLPSVCWLVLAADIIIGAQHN